MSAIGDLDSDTIVSYGAGPPARGEQLGADDVAGAKNRGCRLAFWAVHSIDFAGEILYFVGR